MIWIRNGGRYRSSRCITCARQRRLREPFEQVLSQQFGGVAAASGGGRVQYQQRADVHRRFVTFEQDQEVIVWAELLHWDRLTRMPQRR
jgi:hypothetical protein